MGAKKKIPETVEAVQAALAKSGDSDTGCGFGFLTLCVGAFVIILVLITDPTPTDCQRACEPACMVEFVAESAEQPMVCRCGACP